MKKTKGTKKSKRPKVLKRDDRVDFLSNMPDAILLLILSRLPSTEEVIQTSILSRRWRFLWTSIQSLDLAYFRHRGRNSFKEFVNWVLLNKSVDLDRFRLDCDRYYSMSIVGRWIHAAVKRNVKELDLSFSPKDESEDIEMPHSLVTCTSLEVLRLSSYTGRLNLPSFSGCCALRVLELDGVKLLDGDSFKCFLESCPLLEDLALIYCKKFNPEPERLCISCPKLKMLNLHDGKCGLSGCLKISCPNLVFLKLEGYVVSDIFIERLDLLKEAVIGFFYVDNFSVLSGGISQVESLWINLCFLYECINDAHDPALPNLKTLELTTTRATFIGYPFLFIRILKYFPKLESLRLIIENDYSFAEGFLRPEVKSVESIEYNGEKPKLVIKSYGDEWMYKIANWGKEARLSYWTEN